jgi:acyl dehydratase
MVQLHRPFPSRGSAVAASHVCGLRDRGVGRGAMIAVQTDLVAPNQVSLATVTALLLARGDGGCGDGPPPPQLRSAPGRRSDARRWMSTRADQALLYGMSGDHNPLHHDPIVARARGFQGPILHGLCGFAFAARAVIDAHGGCEPPRLMSHQARFAGPIYPGESLHVDLWQEDDGVAFEVRSVEREEIVLADGHSVLAAP